MITYITLLRGINVSGKNPIKMAELRTSLSGLDFSDLKTYIQSGNIVFKSKLKNEGRISNSIKEIIKKDFGFEVPTMTFTEEYLNNIIEKNPYLKDSSIELKTLHVTFLAEKPTAEKIKEIKNSDFLPDSFALGENAIYVHCPNGYGRTKINNTFFEKKLSVQATTRNWKTTLKLRDMTMEINS